MTDNCYGGLPWATKLLKFSVEDLPEELDERCDNHDRQWKLAGARDSTSAPKAGSKVAGQHDLVAVLPPNKHGNTSNSQRVWKTVERRAKR
jgi:hypothetical protein